MGLETSPRMLWSGPGTRKISFSSLSPSLVKILIFFLGMLAKTGLPLLFQVPRVFRRSKALLHSLVQSLNWSRRSFRIQSSARMSLVWSVCCVYELALTLPGLLLILLEHVYGSLLPELVAVSQESSLDRSHSSAVRVGDSLVESLGISKHDFEDGIVNAGHPPSGASCAGCVPASSGVPADGIMAAGLPLLVESFSGGAHTSSAATAGEGLHLDCLR